MIVYNMEIHVCLQDLKFDIGPLKRFYFLFNNVYSVPKLISWNSVLKKRKNSTGIRPIKFGTAKIKIKRNGINNCHVYEVLFINWNI